MLALNTGVQMADSFQVLLDILDDAMRIETAGWGKIRLLDGAERNFHVEAQRGFSDEFLKVFGTVGTDDNVPAVRAAKLKRRVSVSSMAKDLCSEEYRLVADKEGFRAMQNTPVLSPEGRLLGILSTCYDHAYLPSSAEGIIFDHCAARAAKVVQALLQDRH
jgi:hypothetical protein